MPADLRILCQRLQTATMRHLAAARTLFLAAARRPPEVHVLCDLRGAAAGQAVRQEPGRWLIRYNSALVQRYGDAFIESVVPHEVAHVVAGHCKAGYIRPHGAEWRSVMGFFGISDPARCHGFDVPREERKAQRRWSYRCRCRTHALSTTRHNRAAQGVEYRCRSCRSILRRVGEAARSL